MTLTSIIIMWVFVVAAYLIGYFHRYKVDEPKHYERMMIENTLLKADNRNLRSRLQGINEERGRPPHDPADWWKEGE